MGWLPASVVLGGLLLLESAGPGLILGKPALGQAAYVAGLVAAAGIVIGPLIGLAVMFPLLTVAIRLPISPIALVPILALAAVCVAITTFGLGSQGVAVGVVFAVTAAVCCYLSVRTLAGERASELV